MRVLVVGSGGREHALAWRLARSPLLDELHAAPGNPGIASVGSCHPVRADDGEGLLALARSIAADLVVVGPEAPLVAGVADALRQAGVAVLGPSAGAARIEGSKSFAKDVMRAAGIPAAASLPVARPPCVVKADGLAAGKGVFVCRTEGELRAGLAAARSFGGSIVIEELLEGDELSVFALCDGRRAIPLGAARDHKRLGDGDAGPNTGGMGCFTPVPGFGDAAVADLVELIHLPALAELAARNVPFSGILFAGLMLTDDGPRTLEFNCRLGDPEAEALLALGEQDLLEAFAAAASGDLAGVELGGSEGAAVTVVTAAGGYPECSDAGTPITGIAEAEAAGALVFHAGTALQGDRLVTNGGRILAVTGRGDDVAAARLHAYDAVERIHFDGMHFRRDIAQLPDA